MQLHFSCMRNPNSRMVALLGPDTGFDSMAVTDSCGAAYRLMDLLEQEGSLPKTVLYSLNPADNAWIDTLIGAFQGPGGAGETPARLRLVVQRPQAGHGGTPDQPGQPEPAGEAARDAHRQPQLSQLRPPRVLPAGAVRSFGPVGGQEPLPDDEELLGGLVQDICYRNAKRYFNL